MTDTRSRLVRALRFFARPEAFTLECPHCGTVYRIGPRRLTYWNPTTARFTCNGSGTSCGRSYIIGILAWPVYRGHTPLSTPKDQVPGPRELLQLRKEGGGWWMADEDRQRYARPEETNLTLEDERPDRDPEDDE